MAKKKTKPIVDESPVDPDSINPATGEIVDFGTADVDVLADNLEAINRKTQEMYAFKDRIQVRLQAMARWPDNSATARVMGERRVVKVVKPSKEWDHKRLGEFRAKFPKFAYIVNVKTYSVDHAELTKLLGASGDIASQAREFLEKSRNESNSRPSITIEK